jgi:UDP-glucose 4-epimerase
MKTFQILPLALKGTKIKFVKPITKHWFSNVVEDQNLLEVGKDYTVEKVEVSSSSTFVWLQEFPIREEGRCTPFFNYHSFEIVNENQ